MSQSTILVIDDSATIRRLVDSELSQAGYLVVTAANAEDGIERAASEQPDMILLDHQLPGTTGFNVCGQLLEDERLRQIPVVVSSTLRKKAYVEYTDLPNVVDMLPKPYAPELLKTTVANAMETGSLIVASQSDGTAIPEVIGEQAETALSGTFAAFGLRELLDFLNNGSKSGVLEVELTHGRIWFFLRNGRIQTVTATGIDPATVARGIPDTLENLAPVLKFTVGGRNCSEVEGLVELLDRRVLDPRLLRKLLRHQAATLTRLCFTSTLKGFRFESSKTMPPLARQLPLDVSLLALLIDGALACPLDDLPDEPDGAVWTRCTLHGQNLDRAGLSPRQMKVLGLLAESLTSVKIAARLKCEPLEARRILQGFRLAELAQVRQQRAVRTCIALESDVDSAQQIRNMFGDPAIPITGRVVRDRLGLELLLRRAAPDLLLIAADDDTCRQLAETMQQSSAVPGEVRWVAVGAPEALTLARAEDGTVAIGAARYDSVIERPFTAASLGSQLAAVLDSRQPTDNPACVPAG